MLYPITEIFYSAQGEGHFVGYAMSFVRLAGCSVRGCAIRAECDEAPWAETCRLRALDIVDRCKLDWLVQKPVVHGRPQQRIVCLTGGEPTDHDLTELVAMFRAERFRVHIETSGERPIDGMPFDWITVSPKTTSYAQRTGHTLKVVVRPEWSWQEINALDSGTQFFHRYLQPLYRDGQPENLQHVVGLVLESGGHWALSTQAHRAWGLH